MASEKISFSENFTSISDLENECNFTELNLPGRLKSLKAVGEAAAHVTDGMFDRLTVEEFKKVKDTLGKLQFKADNGGTSTAWINKITIKVSFK